MCAPVFVERSHVQRKGGVSMNSGPSIRSGSAGSDVRRLQRLLVEVKILSFERIDGNFGSAREAAVKDFQSGNGLTADGIVGPQTWSKLPAIPKPRRLRAVRLAPRCQHCKKV